MWQEWEDTDGWGEARGQEAWAPSAVRMVDPRCTFHRVVDVRKVAGHRWLGRGSGAGSLAPSAVRMVDPRCTFHRVVEDGMSSRHHLHAGCCILQVLLSCFVRVESAAQNGEGGVPGGFVSGLWKLQIINQPDQQPTNQPTKLNQPRTARRDRIEPSEMARPLVSRCWVERTRTPLCGSSMGQAGRPGIGMQVPSL
jgi:hypothetical protein